MSGSPSSSACDHSGWHRAMVRPESWTRPVGASPTRVIAGAPGSRPRFVAERRRAERGVKSLFGGSKRAGCDCSLVIGTNGEPSRSSHGEGHVLRFRVDAAFISRFPVQKAGNRVHMERWIPAEDLDELNNRIVGLIEVIASYH